MNYGTNIFVTIKLKNATQDIYVIKQKTFWKRLNNFYCRNKFIQKRMKTFCAETHL